MLFLTLCVALFATASAYIDLRPYNLTAAIMFIQNDLNNDGIITQDEYDKVFAVYDYNGRFFLFNIEAWLPGYDDKIVERHEYVCYITKYNSHMAQVAHALYDEFDSDNDHKLQVLDYDNFFKRMDENGDHIVSDLEFVRFWEMLLLRTEKYSLHEEVHAVHTDSFCTDHGYSHG